MRDDLSFLSLEIGGEKIEESLKKKIVRRKMKKRISIIIPYTSLTHLASLLKSSEPKPKPRARLTHMCHPYIVQLFQIYSQHRIRTTFF